jgi:hypothetical protein
MSGSPNTTTAETPKRKTDFSLERRTQWVNLCYPANRQGSDLHKSETSMLETKWLIFAGWSPFGFFLVGIGIGLSWGCDHGDGRKFCDRLCHPD